MSVLTAPHFHNEAAAYEYVEARIWARGVSCPHCGNVDQEKIGKLGGASTRIGVRKCYACRKPFTVKVGTIFEASHIALHLWLQAIFLMASSKKGISSNQLHRTLGITLKSAWFMSHRIREAMRTGGLGPMGGAGSVVEADETYFGKTEVQPTMRADGLPYKYKSGRKAGGAGKRAVVALVERGGNVRSFHVDKATKINVAAIVAANVHHETVLNTDESRLYSEVGALFAGHDTVNHSGNEYVRGSAYTNTVEGVFSIFKRGMKGIYQHCGEKHLHRYLAEYDFRYNNRVALGCDDVNRTDRMLTSVVGKRLKYQTLN